MLHLWGHQTTVSNLMFSNLQVFLVKANGPYSHLRRTQSLIQSGRKSPLSLSCFIHNARTLVLRTVHWQSDTIPLGRSIRNLEMCHNTQDGARFDVCRLLNYCAVQMVPGVCNVQDSRLGCGYIFNYEIVWSCGALWRLLLVTLLSLGEHVDLL